MSQEQEQATLDYWKLSMLFHQGIGTNMSTSQAIHETSRCAWNVGSHRRIHHKLLNLQQRIIHGKQRKKKQPATFNLLVFRGYNA